MRGAWVGRLTPALGAEQHHTGLRETGGLADGDPSSADSANLDLLRSTAVILVLVNHLLLFLGVTHEGEFLRPLGRWGVLLFFVHSSFVLMLSLERQSRLRYTHPYSVFLLRRLFRIFPLSVLLVVVVCWFRLPLGHLESQVFLPAQFTAVTVVSNLLLIQNLTASESVLDPLWSLPYEVQMCLVLPLLFGLAIASEGITALLLLWAASCLGSITLSASGFPIAFLRYAPWFLAGVVGYRMAIGSVRQWPAPAWPLMLLAITVAYLLFPVDAVGWVCCLGVGLLIPQVRELDEGYLREGCRWVARYSYGVYLSHAVLIWLAFDELATWPVVARWCLFAVTTVVVPVALYHAIEAPLIALGRRLVRWRFQRRPLATARGRPSPRAEFLRARREAKVLSVTARPEGRPAVSA